MIRITGLSLQSVIANIIYPPVSRSVCGSALETAAQVDICSSRTEVEAVQSSWHCAFPMGVLSTTINVALGDGAASGK